MKSLLISEERVFGKLQKLATKLNDLGEIEFLVLQKEKKEESVQNGNIIHFSQKDLGLFGKIKSDELKKLLQKKRDNLFVLGDIPETFVKSIAQIPVRKRIGINSDANLNFDVKLRTKEEEVQQMTNFANEILEKIKQ